MTYNYQTLRELLGNEEKKRIAMHTYLVPGENNSLVIRVGSTIKADLATFNSDGRIVVDANKARSAKTRELINEYVPFFSLVAHEGFWFWVEKGQENNIDNPIALFSDGDTVYEEGRLDFQRGVGDAMALLSYKSKVREYAAFLANEAPHKKPTSQDCWECFIYKFGTTPLGTDTDHIKRHIDNNEIVPSLIRNAQEGQMRGYAFTPGISSQHREEVAKVVRKYLVKTLGLPSTVSLTAKINE